MNTGIGDAINLAWKLAAVLRNQAGDELLASYEAERIGFARRLVRPPIESSPSRPPTGAWPTSCVCALLRSYCRSRRASAW